jgi:hypothetical protein
MIRSYINCTLHQTLNRLCWYDEIKDSHIGLDGCYARVKRQMLTRFWFEELRRSGRFINQALIESYY